MNLKLSAVLMTATEIEMTIAMEILLYQIVSDQAVLMKCLQLRRHPILPRKKQRKIGFQNERCKQLYFTFKNLIDQAQELLHNFQNNVNVALDPEPSVFDLDVANYLKSQDNSQNHSWKKETTLIIGDSIL